MGSLSCKEDYQGEIMNTLEEDLAELNYRYLEGCISRKTDDQLIEICMNSTLSLSVYLATEELKHR